MAQTLVQRLVEGEMIETEATPIVSLKVQAAMTEELSVEDHINEEVREYLNKYAEEMRRTGASYQEMFKKIKSELVRRKKVII
jgi:hypothetical protein